MSETNNLPTIFDYQSSHVRVIMRDGKPWFVASDVCTVLGLGNVSLTVNGNFRTGNRGLDEDEKDNIMIHNVVGRLRKTLCVNESGLYHLIFKSYKPEAQMFRRWVTQDVLPSIRKTGTYFIQPSVPTHHLSQEILERILPELESDIPPGFFTITSLLIQQYAALATLLDESGLDTGAHLEKSVGRHCSIYCETILHLPEGYRRQDISVKLASGRIVYPWLYDIRYQTVILQWFWNIYFPEKLPEYRRYRQRRLGLSVSEKPARKQLASNRDQRSSPAQQLPLFADSLTSTR